MIPGDNNITFQEMFIIFINIMDVMILSVSCSQVWLFCAVYYTNVARYISMQEQENGTLSSYERKEQSIIKYLHLKLGRWMSY